MRIAAVVLAVGLSLLALLSSPQRVRLEVEPSPASPPVSATDLHTPATRTLAARGIGGVTRTDRRSAFALQPGATPVSDREEPALPAGELEVVARDADQPASGWVVLQRVATNDLTVPFDRLETTEAVLEDGVARFHDLPRGLLLVGVHVGSDPPHRALLVNSLVRGARLEFELGSAAIHGRIRAPDGAGVGGARVIVTGPGSTVVASTAADGSYRAGERFPAGRYTVAVDGFSEAGAFPRRRVDLTPGSTREVSFGPGSDLSRWRGRVLTASHDPVREGDGLDVRTVQLVARAGRGAALAVDVVNGAIDQWFERGVYTLRAGSKARERGRSDLLRDLRAASSPGPDAIDLSSDLVRDVRLPGFVLCGRVEPPREGAASITLRGDRSTLELRAEIDAEGAFRFVGLEPGDYQLRWATNNVGAVALDPHGPLETYVDLSLPRRGE